MQLDSFIGFIIFVVIVFATFRSVRKLRQEQRAQFLSRYSFPAGLSNKLREKYPHLTDDQVREVIGGLREYFQICLAADRKMIAMPSQAVDHTWHEFILFTRKYQTFCKKGFGRFLHHTPAEGMKSKSVAQEGIKRAWRIACHREGLAHKHPSAIPSLFTLDKRLNIPDGFHYTLNCRNTRNNDFCATHIGCTSGCAGGSDSGGIFVEIGSNSDSSCGGWMRRRLISSHIHERTNQKSSFRRAII